MLHGFPSDLSESAGRLLLVLVKLEHPQVNRLERSQPFLHAISDDVFHHLRNPLPAAHDDGELVSQSGGDMGACLARGYDWHSLCHLAGSLQPYIVKAADDRRVEPLAFGFFDEVQDVHQDQSLVVAVFQVLRATGQMDHGQLCPFLLIAHQELEPFFTHQLDSYRVNVQNFLSHDSLLTIWSRAGSHAREWAALRRSLS